MKHIKLISMVIIGLLMLTVAPVIAQEVIVAGYTPPPLSEWFGSLEQVYAVVVVIGGYLSAKIPGLNQINNATYRVLAFAVLVGAGFWLYGADIVGLAINYFFSTSFYEVVLKAFAASPKTKAAKG